MRVGRVSWLIKGKNYGGKMESQKILGVKKKKRKTLHNKKAARG